MDFSGLNNLNQLAPQTATQTSRAEPKPERTPADPRGHSFGDVLASRGGKPAPKAFARTQKSEEAPADPAEAAAPDAAPAPTAPHTPIVAAFNVAPKTERVEAVEPDESQDAWGDFLGKMNDEFGVSAEDVLHAFESLSDEDLARTPEETTDQMVAALGLTGQPAALAKTYFRDLIQRTEAPALAEANARPAAAVPVATPADLHRAVERMDAHLMMNSPTARASSVPGARAATFTTPSSEDASVKSEARVETPTREATAFDDVIKDMKPVTDEKVEPKVDRLVREMLERRPESRTAEPAVPNDVAPALTTATPPPAPQATTAFAAAPAPSFEVETEVEVAAPSREPVVGSAKANLADSVFKSARKAEDETADSDTDSDDFSDNLTSGLETRPTGGASAARKSEFASELKANAPAGPALPPDLVDNARVMLRNGGGEMRVTMNADGLGEVAMKVNVKDGKVSVEMLTENQETKRLLEHQLDELKSQLISNNLQVDKLHVDTGSNLSRQNDQSSDGQQRQAAREQSFAQLNQQSGGQSPQQQQARRQMYDASASRAYGAVGPAGRGGFATPPPTAAARSQNSRRLNLVA